MNLENNKFLLAHDRITDTSINITLHDNKKDVTFYFESKNQQPIIEPRNMKVLYQDLQQVSFAGMFNRAPFLATYYPLFDVLIYSQQSVWPQGNFSGVRGMLFYAKCKDVE